MIKGQIQEENIIIVNIYTLNMSNTSICKTSNVTAIKGKSGVTIIVEDFSTHLTHQWTDHSDRKLTQKQNRHITQ